MWAMRTSPSWRRCAGIPGRYSCSTSWKKPTRRFSRSLCPSGRGAAAPPTGQMSRGAGAGLPALCLCLHNERGPLPLRRAAPGLFLPGRGRSSTRKKGRHASGAGGAAVSGERRGPAGPWCVRGSFGRSRGGSAPDPFPAPGCRGAACHCGQTNHLPGAGVWPADHPGGPGHGAGPLP